MTKTQQQVALVTGAGAGIGRATAIALAADGFFVVVSDINLHAATSVAEQIKAEGGAGYALRQDVVDEAGWRDTVDQIIASHGGLHALINNAGVATICGIEDESLEGWRRTQSINADGVFLGCRAAISAMKHCGGVIVNVSSIEGIVGDPMLPAYNASKGSVRALTKSIALYCARQGFPIRVNSIHPGYVATPLVSNALAELDASAADEFTASVMAKIPMGRMAEPEEIASGIRFLVSEDSSYMTGAELIMDGGYTAA